MRNLSSQRSLESQFSKHFLALLWHLFWAFSGRLSQHSFNSVLQSSLHIDSANIAATKGRRREWMWKCELCLEWCWYAIVQEEALRCWMVLSIKVWLFLIKCSELMKYCWKVDCCLISVSNGWSENDGGECALIWANFGTSNGTLKGGMQVTRIAARSWTFVVSFIHPNYSNNTSPALPIAQLCMTENVF